LSDLLAALSSSGKFTGPQSVGTTTECLLDVLKTHSNKDVQTILKMVCAAHGLKAVSTFSPTDNQRLSAPTKRSENVTRGLPPRGAPKGNPKLKEIRDRINIVNKQISEKSKLTGGKLDSKDPLILQRDGFFRTLKEYKPQADGQNHA